MSWTEASTDSGRVYYFNAQTGESTWTRPEGVPIISLADAGQPGARKTSSSAEQPLPGANATAMAKISGSTSSTANMAGSWRELSTQDGRKYYINTVTKATVWEMPAEYRDFLDRQQNKGVATVDRVAAEERFVGILREAGVKSDWEWEQALRAIIDHPSYKCLPSLHERKEAFARYKQTERVREREERFREMQEARMAFNRMLEEEPRVQVGLRWPDAMEILQERPEYGAVTSPRDRAELFDAYMAHLKRTRGSERKVPAAAAKFTELLQSLAEISVETPWKEAIEIISASPAYKDSPELQRLEPIDMLIEYEKHIKELERQEANKRREERLAVRRKERMARQEMRKVIEELIASRKLTAITTWKDFCGLVGTRPCFQDMITPHPNDPTPLDFYWDALDALQRSYIPDRRLILEAATEGSGDAARCPKDLYKFQDRVRAHQRFSEVRDLMNIELVFRELALRPSPPQLVHSDSLQKPAAKHSEDDQAHAVDRKLVEKYKHLIKHWKGSPSILIDSTYEDFRPLLQSHLEFQDISDESVRRLYFDKYIHHLKRKAGLTTAPAPSVTSARDDASPGRRLDAEGPEEGEVIEPLDNYRPTRSRSYY